MRVNQVAWQYNITHLIPGAHRIRGRSVQRACTYGKYKTLALMVSIFGNRTLILTLHDSPWSQVKSDRYYIYKPHSGKRASEAEDAKLPRAKRVRLEEKNKTPARSTGVPTRRLNSARRTRAMLPRNCAYFSRPLEFFLYAFTHPSTVTQTLV